MQRLFNRDEVNFTGVSIETHVADLTGELAKSLFREPFEHINIVIRYVKSRFQAGA
jgi:hypothetical protein